MGMVMNALLVHKWVWELVLHTGGKIGKAPLQVAKQSVQHGIVKHCETKYSTPHCLQASVADADASETSTRHIQNLEQILQHKLELQNLLDNHNTVKTTPGWGERPEQQQRCSTSWDQQTFMWDLIIQPHIGIILIIIMNIIMLMIIIFNMHNLFNGYQVNQNQALNFQVVTNISNSKF